MHKLIDAVLQSAELCENQNIAKLENIALVLRFYSIFTFFRFVEVVVKLACLDTYKSVVVLNKIANGIAVK